MRKEHQFHLGALLIGFLVLMLLQNVLQAERIHQMPYSEFKQALAEGRVAEVTLTVRDLILRAEESTPDLYASIDLVADKLERQVLRYKEKLVAHGGRGGRPAAGAGRAAGVAVEEGAVGGEPRVVKVKRFALKPLAVEDAVVHMDLLGHAFFVFRNAQTEEVNVIYRRRDGAYGLIEPEG